MGEQLSVFQQAPIAPPRRPRSINDLPEFLPMVSMWHAWASLLANGTKTVETRVWQWKRPPCLLAIHVSMTKDDWKVIPEPERVPGWRDLAQAAEPVEPGCLCALVWTDGPAWRMRPEDKAGALVYRDGLWAFNVHVVTRLRGVKRRGAQGFPNLIDRDVVYAAIEAQRMHEDIPW